MRRTAIALLLLLGGAAAALAQPSPAKPNQPKPAAKPAAAAPQAGPCVGVVTELGAKFTVGKPGFSVFGNVNEEMPVYSWRIDDIVIAKIGSAFGKRAAVKRIPYRKEAFAGLLATPAPLRMFHDRDAELGDGVRALASAAGAHCAAYVFVTRAFYTLGNSRWSIGGIGVISSGGVLSKRIDAYALFNVRLYDGETFKLVKMAKAPSGESVFLDTFHGPHRELDEQAWPDPPAAATQSARLRETIRELVAQGMDAALAELPLITH
jgi:hypothetical protein